MAPHSAWRQLWAPWRFKLFEKAPAKTCLFCRTARSRKDRKNLVVRRYQKVFVILNRYPYNNGHCLVAPVRHIGRVQDLSAGEWSETLQALQSLEKNLKRILKAQGFNIGLNLGRLAGAAFAGHLHWHVVPRWEGDTNFMLPLGETKVISQSLNELYSQLKKPWG